MAGCNVVRRQEKIVANGRKYRVSECQGSSRKYTAYSQAEAGCVVWRQCIANVAPCVASRLTV